jgi:hypothetical protein
LSFDHRWRTETSVALAAGIYAERAFDRMPILADALEEAGCDHAGLLSDHAGLLTHLRTTDDLFTRADWCLWNLLDLDR